MKLEPPNLGIPLYGRDYSKYRIAIFAGLAAWLWHRPTGITQAAISVVIGGAFLWLAFASPISHYMGRHRFPLVRGIWLVTVTVGVVWFMRHALPFFHRLV